MSDKEKLIYQLFVGKVSEIIGFEQTTKLLIESRTVIEKAFINRDKNETK